MISSLHLSPLVELIADVFRLQGPAATADLRYDLVVILRAKTLGQVLVRLAIQHECIHGPFDPTGRLALFHLFQSCFRRSLDVGLDVSHGHLRLLSRQLAQWLLEAVNLLGRFGTLLFLPRG